MKNQPLTTFIAIFSLVLSVGNLLYTVYVFEPTHRPYVGIVGNSFAILPSANNPRSFVWRLVVKNAGSVPALITKSDMPVTLTAENHVYNISDDAGFTRSTMFLMPDATTELMGQYIPKADSLPVNRILDGSAILRLIVTIDYTNPGLFKLAAHHYKTTIRFDNSGNLGPTFVPERTEGD